MLLPQTTTGRAVTSWPVGTISALRAELGVALRAAIVMVADFSKSTWHASRCDRVLRGRAPPILGQVTSLAAPPFCSTKCHLVGTDQRLVDLGYVTWAPRIRCWLRPCVPTWMPSATSAPPHGHCSASQHVRYRIRRIEQLLSTSPGDLDVVRSFAGAGGQGNARLSN